MASASHVARLAECQLRVRDISTSGPRAILRLCTIRKDVQTGTKQKGIGIARYVTVG